MTIDYKKKYEALIEILYSTEKRGQPFFSHDKVKQCKLFHEKGVKFHG